MLGTPEARLYEAIAENDYHNPNVFLLDTLNDSYRGKAILSSAISFRAKGLLQDAGKLLKEASTLSNRHKDIVTMYQIQKELAVVLCIDGNHYSALKILESALPLAKAVFKSRPAFYFDYLNSRAVELGDLGRLEEAWLFCRIALASPFSGRYISWLETGREIQEKMQQRASRSRISGTRIQYDNVVDLADARAARPSQLQVSEVIAPVVSLIERLEQREEMVNKNKQKETEQTSDDYAHLEKRAELHRIIADPDTTSEELDELLRAYQKMKIRQLEQK